MPGSQPAHASLVGVLDDHAGVSPASRSSIGIHRLWQRSFGRPIAWCEELCRIVIERFVVKDRLVEAIVWTSPARPFFETTAVVPPRGFKHPPAV
jgi:hypothetical protein